MDTPPGRTRTATATARATAAAVALAVIAATVTGCSSDDDAAPVDDLRAVTSPGTGWVNDLDALGEAVGGEFVPLDGHVAEIDPQDGDDGSAVELAVPWSRTIGAGQAGTVCAELAAWVVENAARLPGEPDTSFGDRPSLRQASDACLAAATRSTEPGTSTSDLFLSLQNTPRQGRTYAIFAETRLTDGGARVTAVYSAGPRG